MDFRMFFAVMLCYLLFFCALAFGACWLVSQWLF